LEAALIMPVIILLLLIILMSALYFFQRSFMYHIAADAAIQTSHRWSEHQRRDAERGLYWRIGDYGLAQLLGTEDTIELEHDLTSAIPSSLQSALRIRHTGLMKAVHVSVGRIFESAFSWDHL